LESSECGHFNRQSFFLSSHVSKEVDADLAMFGLHPEDSCQIDQTQDSKPLEPSTDMCLDESMVPHQGMNNPHHMFIQRKPYPHGLKYYTIADKHGCIWNLKLHRRTAFDTTKVNDPLLLTKGKDHGWTRGPKPNPKSTVDVVVSMLRGLERGHHIILDSYYGGVPLSWKLFGGEDISAQ